MIFRDQYFKTRPDHRGKEQGNVLFLILIAVALFAALSYAVTQTTRSSGGNASGEVELISSAQLTQYPAGVRTSIIRMVISGTDISEMFFDTPSDWAANLTTGPQQERAVFHPNGGGATFQIPPQDLVVGGEVGDGLWHFNTNFQIPNIGLNGDGGSELIAFLPGVSNGVCGRINDELGLGNAGIDYDTGDAEALYETIIMNGAASAAGYTQTAFDNDASDNGAAATFPTALSGQPFGCFVNDPGGGNEENVYYHVLIER